MKFSCITAQLWYSQFMRGQKLKDIKSFNRKQVLNRVREADTITVAEISQATGMSRTIISNSLQHFSKVGIVQKTGKGESTNEGGKKPLLYSLVPDYKLFAITHENVDFLYSVIADLNGNFLAERTDPVKSTDSNAHVVNMIVTHYRDMLDELDYPLDLLHSIVVGVNCISNIETGVMIVSQHFKSWDNNINIKKMLCEKLNLKSNVEIYLDNVIRFQTLAEEYCGKAAGCKNAVVIEVRAGLVAGTVISGELYRGNNLIAGEIGHMTIDINDDYICHCGKKGCFENKVALRHLVRLGKKVLNEYKESCIYSGIENEDIKPEELFAAADNGDLLARYLLNESAKWFAIGISNMILNINPEIIIIQGDYEHGSGFFNDQLKHYLNQGLLARMQLEPQIEYSTLGYQRCLIGAAYFLREQFFDKQH